MQPFIENENHERDISALDLVHYLNVLQAKDSKRGNQVILNKLLDLPKQSLAALTNTPKELEYSKDIQEYFPKDYIKSIDTSLNEIMKSEILSNASTICLNKAAAEGKIMLLHVALNKDPRDENDFTPLMQACAHGQMTIVEYLTNKGCDINARSKNKNTPLQLACQKGHTNTVKFLLSNEALNKDPRDEDDQTPLIWACRNGHMTIAEYLIDKGCDINARNKYKWTSLHSACRQGHKNIVNLLLSKGADYNAKDKYNDTPLDDARNKNNDDIVSLLESFISSKQNQSQ